MKFHDFISNLKSSLYEEGLSAVFKSLIDNFNQSSSQFNTLVSLAAEHKDLDKSYITGIIDFTIQSLHLAQIRGRLLMFIDSLKPEDILLFSHTTQSTFKTLEVGLIDLPVKVLVVMGKMTPQIAREHLDKYKHEFKKQSEGFEKAKDKKEKLASVAFNKLKILKNRQSNEVRLFKKYINDFIGAFKDLDKQMKGFSNALDGIREDLVIVCLYQIELAFSKGELNDLDLEYLKESLDKVVNSFEDSIDLLVKNIEMERLNLFRYKNEFKLLGIQGGIRRSLNSKIILKDSLSQFIRELQIIREVLIVYQVKLLA